MTIAVSSPVPSLLIVIPITVQQSTRSRLAASERWLLQIQAEIIPMGQNTDLEFRIAQFEQPARRMEEQEGPSEVSASPLRVQ